MRYKIFYHLFFISTFLLTVVFLTACSPPLFHRKTPPYRAVEWQNTYWSAHGSWSTEDEELFLDYTWEEANYFLQVKPPFTFNEGIITFAIDVHKTVDCGFLFGIEEPPTAFPYIPDKAMVFVVRNRDIYFNQRLDNQWQTPTAEKEIPDLTHKRIQVVLHIKNKEARAFLYNRETGALITTTTTKLPDKPYGGIGFYAYIEQDIHTTIHSLEIIDENF